MVTVSETAVATCRTVALAWPRCRLWAEDKRSRASSRSANRPRWNDSPRVACGHRSFPGPVAAPRGSAVSRAGNHRSHGLKGMLDKGSRSEHRTSDDQ